jgi:hypothetical protein
MAQWSPAGAGRLLGPFVVQESPKALVGTSGGFGARVLVSSCASGGAALAYLVESQVKQKVLFRTVRFTSYIPGPYLFGAVTSGQQILYYRFCRHFLW